MRIIIHAGAQCTDDERLLTTLIRNKKVLTKAKVAVPHPKSYRIPLRKTLNQMLRKGQISESTERLRAITLPSTTIMAETVILSNARFFGLPTEILTSGQLYPNATNLLEKFIELYCKEDVHLYFAVRNPASFLPAVFAASEITEFNEFLDNIDPFELKWSELITRIRHAFPKLPITLWSNEDSPFIWGQILRRITHLPAGQNLSGDFDIFLEMITPKGLERFKSYLEKHPSLNLRQLSIVMGAFAEKFGRREVIMEDVEAPGWDKIVIQDLTELYYEDLKALPLIPNVSVILP